MLSILTLTYKRKKLLEEAIESFLQQTYFKFTEMVIINDDPAVDYFILYPNITIINCKERFNTISAKLKFGYKQCKYPFIYRLDDDDLLLPWSVKNTIRDISDHLGFDIYRSDGNYYFNNNKFEAVTSNVNNGNVYTKEYLDRIEWPEKSGNEDIDITYKHNAKIYTSEREKKTMIYRWGMPTYHISSWGDFNTKAILTRTDGTVNNMTSHLETGKILLKPHFDMDYYSKIMVKE